MPVQSPRSRGQSHFPYIRQDNRGIRCLLKFVCHIQAAFVTSPEELMTRVGYQSGKSKH
ncbi:MAG: hypothetical protein ACTSSI_17260 [Candidatus Helarchaeota archaeon]